MEFATGALGTLLPKLSQLLQDEYNLHKGVKKNIEFLTTELECIQAALCSVGEVTPEQLSELVRIWARDAREVSYDMEDIVDTFLVHVQDPAKLPSKRSAKKFIKKMMGFVTKAKTRHDIGQEIEDIKERVKEIAERRDRYKVDAINPVKIVPVDPRITHLYTTVADLVSIDDSREDLITRLTKGDDTSLQKQRIVSVVRFGGLGKTTLAKAVYDKLKGQFDRTAFVSVGRNPVLKKVLKAISVDLGMYINFEILDYETQLVDRLREFLEYKRYFLVIDGVWETKSWDIIKLAFIENNRASRIITTTRNHEVAGKAGEVYKLQPLSDDFSKKLFFARIFVVESKSSDHQPDDEVSDKILRKCGGIPLAIITMASLLVGKRMDKWSEVHQSIGFANKGNQQVKNTEKILSFSYYDLPSHLRTCLLYISVFPEDYFIEISTLVWMWIAEGFVEERQGMSSFEIGEGYFNDLVNRSMIQMVEKGESEIRTVYVCAVHDMVLDLIRSISYEENFTILDNNNNKLGGRVRRLALQNDTTVKAHMDMQLVRSFQNDTTVKAHMDMQLVRSFISVSWQWDIDNGISFSSFKLVRVLALHTTSSSYSSNLRHQHQQVPLRNLLHLRYIRLSDPSIVLPAEEIGNLKFLQTPDVERLLVGMSVELLTELLCLRFRMMINTVPYGIGKLTSLHELQISYDGEEEHWKRFVKGLCGLRELRVFDLNILKLSKDVEDDMVLPLLRSLQKLEKLFLTTTYICPVVHADTAAWEAAGFLFSRRLRRLYLKFVRFSRFPSFCINPSRLLNLAQLFLHVDAMDDEDMRILGGLPQLWFLDLTVHSIVEVDCYNTTTDDDGCLFQKLRHCSIWYDGVRFLLPSLEDSGSVSFCMEHVSASMILGSERENTTVCKAAGVAPTLMARFQKLSFHVYVQEYINHDDGRVVSLALKYFASLQNVTVRIQRYAYGATGPASSREVEAALRRAADVHPNRPKLEVYGTG